MFKTITYKIYPNKNKADNPKQPDIRGSVEVVYDDGTIREYDYSEWRPGEGKSQTLIKWGDPWKRGVTAPPKYPPPARNPYRPAQAAQPVPIPPETAAHTYQEEPLPF